MKLPILLCLLSLLVEVSPTRAADWTVEIVPTRASGGERMLSFSGDAPAFYVLLENTTTRDLQLWRDWCSWGYSCLSFTVSLPDGSSFELHRRRTFWTKNYPDFTTIPPGRHYVCQVSFGKNPDAWEGFPKNFRGGEASIRAYYTVEKTPEAGKSRIWTGQVSSVPEKITFR